MKGERKWGSSRGGGAHGAPAAAAAVGRHLRHLEQEQQKKAGEKIMEWARIAAARACGPTSTAIMSVHFCVLIKAIECILDGLLLEPGGG